MGQVSQLIKDEMSSEAGGSATPSSVLLDSYHVAARPGLPSRTPKTPAPQNTVMEVRRSIFEIHN